MFFPYFGLWVRVGYENGETSRLVRPGYEDHQEKHITLRKVRADLTAAKDNRYQVIRYNPNGGSRYKKTIKGKREAQRHHDEMAVKLRSGGVAITEDRNKTFREFTVE